jgi:hypothetical protein
VVVVVGRHVERLGEGHAVVIVIAEG